MADSSTQADDAAPLPKDSAAVTPRSILEAMLFVGNAANEPLERQRAADCMRGVALDEVDVLVDELNAEYEELGCPYRIVAEGAGYRLTLAPAWNGLRQRFYGKMRDARLSPAAIEVLSLVAYRQPMTREQVDELRGKESGPLLRQLLRRRLLRLELGDGDGPRRQYTTTDRFLKLFGLESLAELPQTDEVESTH